MTKKYILFDSRKKAGFAFAALAISATVYLYYLSNAAPLNFDKSEWQQSRPADLRGVRYRMWLGDRNTIESFTTSKELIISNLGKPDINDRGGEILIYHLGRKGAGFSALDQMNLYLYRSEKGTYECKVVPN